jgi:hypothetical protein
LRKLLKILILVAFSLSLGIGIVHAMPMPGSCFELTDGMWNEYLFGGGEGAPGNWLVVRANDFSYAGEGGALVDAVFLGSAPADTDLIDYTYLTTYSSGSYLLQQTIWGGTGAPVSALVNFEVTTHKIYDTSGPTPVFVEQWADVAGDGVFQDPSELSFMIYATAITIDDPYPLWTGSSLPEFIGGPLENVEMKVDPVPEPATMLLLGSGLVGLAGFGRKKFFKK